MCHCVYVCMCAYTMYMEKRDEERGERRRDGGREGEEKEEEERERGFCRENCYIFRLNMILPVFLFSWCRVIKNQTT